MLLSLLLLLLHLPNPLKVSRSLYASARGKRRRTIFPSSSSSVSIVDFRRKKVFRTLPSSWLNFLPTFIYTGIHYILRDFERVP